MIIINFELVSLTASPVLVIVQIGDVGGIETSSYLSTAVRVDDPPIFASATDGFLIRQDNANTAGMNGTMTLTLKDSSNFTWVETYQHAESTTQISAGAGVKSLSAELTQLSISGGTFDLGSINIMYQ